MKKKLLPIIFGFAITATAQAGPDPMPSGKAIIPPPAPSCLWSWFAGGSAGTVSGDWDEDIYTLHVGTERKCDGDNCSHAFYLEIGYTEKERSRNAFNPGTSNQIAYHSGPVKHIPYYESYDLEIEIIPITLNYKYECALTNKLNWYIGAGAGVAIVDAKLRHQESGDPASNDNDSDVTFYAHVFAGLVYNISPSFEIFGGARYIYMSDPTLGDNLDYHGVDKMATLDGDIQYELGARFNF